MTPVQRLAAGVAHEFNNLLTSIHGYSELVLRTLGTDDPRRTDVERILAASKRAAQLTRQLLMFSQEAEATRAPVDLNRMLARLEPAIRRECGASIAVVLALGRDVDHILGDEAQLEVCVMAMVRNAAQAMPSGGRLTITTCSADGRLSSRGGALHRVVQCHVADTGVGMTEDARTHLFEPFFTTRPFGTAVGLSLAAVLGIVRTHEGDIDVESTPGEGTVFTVSFPAWGRGTGAEGIVAD